MGSLAGMLLGQAAPSSALSGLSPEAQAALQALNGGTGVPEQAPAPAPTPAPQPATPEQQGLIAKMLGGLRDYFMGGTSAKELAGPQPTPAPLTPEQIAERNRRIAGGQ